MSDWLDDCEKCGGPCIKERCIAYYLEMTEANAPAIDQDKPDPVVCEHGVDLKKDRCDECEEEWEMYPDDAPAGWMPRRPPRVLREEQVRY